MVLDSLWEEEEWMEMFRDIDNFVTDIKNDTVAMEFIDELDKTLYFDDSLGKQKEMRFTNFESENFGTEKNIHKEENYLLVDKFEECEGDQRCLRLMSSGTVTEMTEEEQMTASLVSRMTSSPSPQNSGSDNKCPGKVDNKLVKSFACTWPDCDKRYKKSSHLKVTNDFNSSCLLFLPISGPQAGAHRGEAVPVPPP